MKEIVLDTETTGISVKEGHRIVEIACIELENLIPWLKNKVSLNNETTAYLCYEGICERPLTSASALLKRLSEVGSLYRMRIVAIEPISFSLYS